MYRLSISATMLVLGVSCLQAQIQPCTTRSGPAMDMQVRLAFDDQSSFGKQSEQIESKADSDASHIGGGVSSDRHQDFATGMQIRVQLQDDLGGNLQESSPNAEGKVVFRVCSRLSYRLRVSGANINEAAVESVNPGSGDRVINVALHHKGNQPIENPNRTTISASRLNVPRKAQRELDKGNTALADGKLEEAKKRFGKAIELYPQFDQAYNNLGVVLMQLGDVDGGKKAFEEAVRLNDHFARAYINLAKIAIDDKQFKAAYETARKALSTEPLSPSALFLAAEAAFFTGAFDETIAYARSLHALPHEKFALAHFLSAKSLQARNLSDAAVAEYELFVREDPHDPNAQVALRVISQLRSSGTTVQ